jgi:hypothetical protein
LFNFTIRDSEGEIEGEPVMRRNNIIQFIDGQAIFASRTKDENTGKYTGTTYYWVAFDSEDLKEDTEGNVIVPDYTSVSVVKTETASEVMYAFNGAYFVEFVEDSPKFLCMKNETFVVTGCEELDEAAIGALESTYVPNDGSTILSAYKITTPTSVNKWMVQIREIEVDGEKTTYVYVQEMFA